MDCNEWETWLLDSDDRHAPPAEVAEHLRNCAKCRQSLQELDALESGWRLLPLAADAERSKIAFLARLSDPSTASPARWPKGAGRRRALARVAMAAAVFVAIACGSWILLPDRQVEASTDVISRLLDWNLDLTQTASADRGRMYAREAGKFRASVAKAHLLGSDEQIARTLLNTAESISKSDDALVHLEEFRDLAGRLEDLMAQSLEQGDEKRAELLARQYRRITESGLTLNLQRAEASGALHLDRPGKLEKIILTDVSQAEALSRLLEKSPNLSRKEIRDALNIRKEHVNRRRTANHP